MGRSSCHRAHGREPVSEGALRLCSSLRSQVLEDDHRGCGAMVNHRHRVRFQLQKASVFPLHLEDTESICSPAATFRADASTRARSCSGVRSRMDFPMICSSDARPRQVMKTLFTSTILSSQ